MQFGVSWVFVFFAHTKLEAFDNVYGPNQVTL